MSLPENSTILRVLIRGIYLSLERSTTLLKQYEALVNAMSPADMFLLASTAHKYRLPTIQSVVQHNFILKMSNAQHHLTGGLPSQPEHSPFLEALRTMYSEEDTFREELRKKLCAVANPASLLNCNNGLKKSVMTACPAYFTEMVAKWKASTTQENYGARCIHCEQTWKWTDFAGNDRQLCCPSCSARATWMTFLAYWLVANGLPRK